MIIITSLNQAKVTAVKEVYPLSEVKALTYPSHVREQPRSDEETRQGAINRAMNALSDNKDAICIGLEGGVMELEGKLYLTSWGALAEEGKELLTAAGLRIELPKHFKETLKNSELSELIDAYTKTVNTREGLGAIGVFTNEHIERKDLFKQILISLKGQLEHRKKFSEDFY